MSSEQTKIGQSTMDKFSNLSQVTVINFKHGKVGKSFIPSVPNNYTCLKRHNSGKSFIPRFMIIYSQQTKNGKPTVSHINSIDYFKLEKNKTSISYSPKNYYKPVKNGSNIPRKATRSVESLLCTTQEKSQRNKVDFKPTPPLCGKSKIPVPISAKKTNILTLNSTKKPTRTSHRNCTKSLDTIKKENVRNLRLNAKKDDQVRVLPFNTIKKDYISSRASTPTSTSTSIKKSLIPVHKLTYTLFKKRVSPMQPSTLTLVKKNELAPTSISNKEVKKGLVCTSSKNKHTSLQKSVNKPASISISHNKVEVSTTTSIIKPELSSISLLYKAEKDLSNIKHQGEENGEGVPSLFGNVFKSIVRFSKDLFSKIL
ncbi:hypothetical protein C1645_746859 [Glomus cerebriforme]|uniref:Uncharacterized protein n=1 Tax=Glomus cerebriforme TaxID=658196 RepID=A0A397TT85_9GLOM|nr:hypothetical protein C1645_746859 [Glomus cerebriforme]